MSVFCKTDVKKLKNAIEAIGSDWMLITAKDEAQGRVNAMTASWGCMGVLWSKPVCILFVRPQRHTHSLTEAQDRFSIAFLGEEHRAALRLCGTLSGRDTDKLAEAGLHTETLGGVEVIREAETVLIVKKLYADHLKEASFLDPALLANYKEKDYHRFYVCEIEEAYTKQQEQ